MQDAEHGYAPAFRPVAAKADVAGYIDFLIKHCAAHEGGVFVAEDDGQVVGMVAVTIQRENSHLESSFECFGFVTDLCVLPDRRREGIGGQLLHAAEEHASSRGATLMKLGSLTANDAARSLYESEGYLPYEVLYTKPL